MSNEAKYNDLMVRHELLREAWMERVEADKNRDPDNPSFYGTGIILQKDGGLRITGLSRTTGRAIFDLTISPFSREIKETT